MALPSTATKTNLDSASDDPKLARAELAALVDAFNALLTHLGISTITSTPLTIGTGLENNSGALQARAASTTQTGIAELATNAEAQAKTDTARVITPSNLAALGASDTFAGMVELATTSETTTGTDTSRAVTPAGVAAALAALTPAPTAASTSEISSQSAVDKFIRPDRLKNAPSVAKCFGTCQWSSSGSVFYNLIGTGYNVSSLGSTGGFSGFRVNFTTAMSGTQYQGFSQLETGSSINAIDKTTSRIDYRSGGSNGQHSFLVFEA